MDASKRSSHGNAYFTGLGKNKRIVFFDNLIKTITDGEILAILAHELGHFSKKHISKHIILSTLMSFLGFFLLNLLYQNKIFFNSHGINYASNHVALILFSLVVGLKHITPQEAVGVLKSKSQRSQYLFIDTRPKPFYDACHVKNSISGEFKSKTKGGKLNKTIVEQYIKNGKTVVFYCNSYRCYRSLNAAIQAVCEWGFPADRIKWFGAGVAGIAQIYRRGVKGYNCEQFL